jgi:hypothetical protein
MSGEANKALVCRFYEEIDKGNLDAMDEMTPREHLGTAFFKSVPCCSWSWKRSDAGSA